MAKVVYDPAVERKAKKIPLSNKTYEALKKKAEREGKTPDEKVAEIVEEKAKPKREKKTVTVEYPVSLRINAYGFLRFSKDLCADLGWSWDMPLKLDKNADGSVTLRKAA
jgi:mRNA-degrading endonuclease RelE of RelBE toxin-antitoxin system